MLQINYIKVCLKLGLGTQIPPLGSLPFYKGGTTRVDISVMPQLGFLVQSMVALDFVHSFLSALYWKCGRIS